MSPWALARLLTSAENVCSACQARLRVRAASHTATVLPSMIKRAARNEKVGGMKLFSVPTYPHTKIVRIDTLFKTVSTIQMTS